MEEESEEEFDDPTKFGTYSLLDMDIMKVVDVQLVQLHIGEYIFPLAGLKKKLLKLACEKECGALQQWIKSICNHLYWVAVSTPNADGQLMLEKWCSLSNHLHNKHQHKGAKFPRLRHD
nr:hypothetical protein BaRGS_011467 [Batillaria attramentaria]